MTNKFKPWKEIGQKCELEKLRELIKEVHARNASNHQITSAEELAQAILDWHEKETSLNEEEIFQTLINNCDRTVLSEATCNIQAKALINNPKIWGPNEKSQSNL